MLKKEELGSKLMEKLKVIREISRIEYDIMVTELIEYNDRI
jgi:hypothetical protein